MANLRVPSPAKINLFLHVNGRRSDGYHLIQTAFQFVNLVDYLTFQVRPDAAIAVHTDLIDVATEDNLIYKAAKLLQDYGNVKQGIDITLEKHIPIGGGLGGGSSNAATTLLILNLLWDLKLTLSELLHLGVKLGADVPIFLYGQAAFAEGIGDQLRPIELNESWLLLIVPPCSVNTGKIFSDSQLTRTTPRLTIAEFLESGGHNDCEPVAQKHFPEIAKALKWLENYSSAKMTGSGSCVFAAFENEETAVNISKEIPESFKGFVVKGLNTSPLHSVINKNWGVAKW